MRPRSFLWLLAGPVTGPLLGLACHAYRGGRAGKACTLAIGAVAWNLGQWGVGGAAVFALPGFIRQSLEVWSQVFAFLAR